MFRAMKAHATRFTVSTRGIGTYEITAEVEAAVRASGIRNGAVTVFACHTSCSLVLMENADPTARKDLHEFFNRIAPENAPYYLHTMEGADDSPSHLRMVLTGADKTIPVLDGRMTLGTWQGLFLFEHRRAPHVRNIAVSVLGA
jgi:secondary thiamine-phosphate synthase enzyme